MNSRGTETGEVLDYLYDAAGRLANAMFAQTFPSGNTALAPTSRAVAHYEYDEVGRVQQLAHYWQSWDTSGIESTEFIFGNACAYDATKGLKTSSSFYLPTSSHSSTSTLHHTETYGYDASLDYLTNANYGDGLANPTQSWTYDPAGNRNNSGYVYNGLNMMTASPWATYVNDPLGYRTSETSGSATTTYTWDILQRMIARTGTTVASTATYEYRADGMRTAKSVGTSVSGYTSMLSRHDATMPFELETLKPDGTVSSNREGIGPRGVDAEETVTGTWSGTTRTLGASTIAYPIYDGHGNRVCTLSRYGTGSWTSDSPRFVDAWGTMRTGSATGGSVMRYCTSIGHLQDDESGFVYMRARYYEPSVGRFVSEDSDRQADNWYVYCGSNPANRFDTTGKEYLDIILGVAILGALYGGIKELIAECLDKKGPLNAGRIMEKAIQSGFMAQVSAILGKTWFQTVQGGLAAARTNAQAALIVTYAVVWAIVIATFIAAIDYECDTLTDQYIKR